MARHYTALLQSMVNLTHRTLKSLPGAPCGPKCPRTAISGDPQSVLYCCR